MTSFKSIVMLNLFQHDDYQLFRSGNKLLLTLFRNMVILN